jgi:peptide deformylase
MAIRDILLLGNPLLTSACADVHKSERHSVTSIGRDLEDTMREFRARHGWGRAIAAPQIGILKRIVFLDVEGPWLIVNPVITDASREMLELWDDCMSFPDLLVRVRRHVSFKLTYRDPEWNERRLRVDGALSELM